MTAVGAVRSPSDHVRARVRLERVVAGLRTEVVRLAFVLDGPRSLLAFDAHPTHRILHHRHEVLLYVRSGSIRTSPARFSSCEPTRPAMKAASSPTNPMSADPRVCCQVSPMKNKPGASVTPRRWMMPPRSSEMPERSIQEKSGRYPVAQTIASISCSLPSSKTA